MKFPVDDADRAMNGEDAVRGVLEKLRIDKGLQSRGPKPIDRAWTVELYSTWNRADDVTQFHLRLTYKRQRNTVMDLAPTDIETRGKSKWGTGNVWRLSAAGIDRAIVSMKAHRLVIHSEGP